MIRKLLTVLLLVALVALWAFGDRLLPVEEIRAEKVRVRDGDTLTLDGVDYRLYGIDAPEYRQTCKDRTGKDWPCGKAARLQLDSFATSGTIICQPQAEDRYHRKVARCSSATVPDLGEAMVQAGLAVSPGERGDPPYGDAEGAAKKAQRGIWQGEFAAPSEWRETHPR
jgi:endonuclease YncB( thermonuclease family)